MKRTYLVTIDVEPGVGTLEEMDRIFEQYITDREFPFMADYSLDPEIREDDGYPGPFARSVTVQLIGYEVTTTSFVKAPTTRSTTKDPA